MSASPGQGPLVLRRQGPLQGAALCQTGIECSRLATLEETGALPTAGSVTYDVALYSRALSTGAAGDEPVAVEIVDE